MNIVNNTNLGFVDEYIFNYQSTIEKKYPELFDHTVEINIEKGLRNTDPMASDDLKKADNIKHNYVLINTNYGGIAGNLNIRFDEEELFALLSHEIGHLAAYYYTDNTDDKTEELFADKCAFELGLGSPMIGAIKKMKEDQIQSGVDHFDFMHISFTPSISFDERIKELQALESRPKSQCFIKKWWKSLTGNK